LNTSACLEIFVHQNRNRVAIKSHPTSSSWLYFGLTISWTIYRSFKAFLCSWRL